MQITLNIKDLNEKQFALLMTLLQIGSALEDKKEPPFQPELPFGDAVIDTSKNEAPKVNLKKAPKTPKKVEEVSEPTPEDKNAVEVPQNDSDSTSQYTLSDVKTKAQELVQKVDRESVKNAINKYAEKLSDVKPEDYPALMEDFKALEG